MLIDWTDTAKAGLADARAAERLFEAGAPRRSADRTAQHLRELEAGRPSRQRPLRASAHPAWLLRLGPHATRPLTRAGTRA